MSNCKILLSNLGYARGISGRLIHHLRYAHRHLYCSPATQARVLRQMGAIITREDPDICCFVEIDEGCFGTGGVNQLKVLTGKDYTCFDIENKYAPQSRLRSFFITRSKSNAFMSKTFFPHEKIFFSHGTKRLIYKICLSPTRTLFIAHLSLSREIRRRQLLEIEKLAREAKGEVIFLGDFNILAGRDELTPLLKGASLVLLNKEEPTFLFHRRHLVLDLCLCSPSIAGKADLRIVPQPFSDHAALVLEIKD